jgi:hypothetical protein
MVALLLPLLTACQSSSTKVTTEWEAPALSEHPFRHLIVVGLELKPDQRRTLEDEFARQLAAAGISAQASYPDARFSLDAIDRDQQAATEAMRKLGADGVLMVRLVDERTVRRHVPSDSLRSAQSPNQFDPAVPSRSWTTYYHSSLTEAGQTYDAMVDRTVVVESNLYSLADGKLRWSARTDTFVQHGAKTDVKIRAFVATLVKHLQAAGAIPAPAATEK